MRTIEQIDKELDEVTQAPSILQDQIKKLHALADNPEILKKEPPESRWLLNQYAGMLKTLLSLPGHEELGEERMLTMAADLINQLVWCAAAMERLDFPVADLLKAISEGMHNSFLKIMLLHEEREEVMNMKPDGETLH